MNKKKLISYIMLITAMLIWGSIGLFRRSIPVPSEFLAFIRGLTGALFMCIILSLKKDVSISQVKKQSIVLLALTGALIGINWIFLFEAFNYTTVATATLCYYMEPTMVILMAPLFFSQRLTLSQLAITILTILGMILVSGIIDNGEIKPDDITGIIFGLSAAFCYALIVISNKRIEAIDTYLKTFIQLSGAAIAMIPYLIYTAGFTGLPDDTSTWLLILFVGIVHTGIAYALYFGAMKELSAQSVAICSYIDPISALIFSALLLGEALTPLGMLGAILIIGTVAIGEFTSKQR